MGGAGREKKRGGGGGGEGGKVEERRERETTKCENHCSGISPVLHLTNELSRPQFQPTGRSILTQVNCSFIPSEI